MINDYGLYFTPAAGQLFNAADTQSEYGEKAIDLKAAQDVAVETHITALVRAVDADLNTGTGVTIAIVADDDGAGGNEVVLLTKTILKAALTKAAGIVNLGVLPRGTVKRQLRAKVTSNGVAATAGKLAVWLVVGQDAVRANAASTI